LISSVPEVYSYLINLNTQSPLDKFIEDNNGSTTPSKEEWALFQRASIRYQIQDFEGCLRDGVALVCTLPRPENYTQHFGMLENFYLGQGTRPSRIDSPLDVRKWASFCLAVVMIYKFNCRVLQNTNLDFDTLMTEANNDSDEPFFARVALEASAEIGSVVVRTIQLEAHDLMGWILKICHYAEADIDGWENIANEMYQILCKRLGFERSHLKCTTPDECVATILDFFYACPYELWSDSATQVSLEEVLENESWKCELKKWINDALSLTFGSSFTLRTDTEPTFVEGNVKQNTVRLLLILKLIVDRLNKESGTFDFSDFSLNGKK